MDIDELKKQWQSMELRVEQLEKDNRRLMTRISRDRFAGLRGKLMARYRLMIIVCVISPVWMLLLEDVYGVGRVLNVCYASFFVITALANAYIYYLFHKIDYSIMTVKEALTATTHLEITRYRLRMLGWLMVVPLLVMMFQAFYETGQDEVINGAWFGLILGAIVGTIFDLKTRRLIRQMRHTLTEELDED